MKIAQTNISRSTFNVMCAFLCAFWTLTGTAAVFAGNNDTWKPVSPAELAMKESSIEKDADAEAIFWEVRVDDSSTDELALNHYIRVKIFNERGREKFSKIDIPYAKGMKIKNVMARIIKADGSIVEIAKEDVLERDIIKADGLKIKAKSFAVPNIEPGVIVEYRYREVIGDAGAVGMRLTFQREIPVENLSYYYKPYNDKAPNFQSFNMSEVNFVKDKKGYYLATRQNVPSFKEEPRMPPEDQVRAWMLLQGVRLNVTDVSMTGFTFIVKDPSDPGSYWGAVSTERAALTKLMNKPVDDIKRTATEVAGAAATPEEKLRKLYEYCQTQIKNVSFDSSISAEQRQEMAPNKTVADVLKHKSGSGGEVDLLFGAMAKALGFETWVAYSGDRSKMFFDPKMANEYFIHRAAIAVNVENDWKFFNPGVRFLPYGQLVWYEEGAWALLVGENKNAWVRMPLSAAEKNQSKRTGKFKLLEDGTLEGKVRVEYTGHQAVTRKLSNYENSSVEQEDAIKEEIKRRIGSAESTNIKVENASDPAKPFVYTYKVRVPDYAQKTGKRLFMQPNFFEYNEKPLFTASTRKHEIYFNYPWAESDVIQIELPAGFALESPDAPSALSDPDKIALNTVQMFISKDGRTLTYKRKFYFGGGGNILFPVGAYPVLKSLFENFNKNDTHGLVLKQDQASNAGTTKTN